MGMSSPSPEYEMPGRALCGLKKFRGRFFYAYQLPPPVFRRFSLDGRGTDKWAILNVLLAPNKRSYGHLKHLMAHKAELEKHRFAAAILNFSVPFTQQLVRIRNADIFLVGVGTSYCSIFLLSDCTVVVALGTREKTSHLSYMEEWIGSGMDWVRVLYASDRQLRSATSPTIILELAAQARDTILSNFTPNVPAWANLSPIGRGLVEYFKEDPRAWGASQGSFIKAKPFNKACFGWAERIICEAGAWAGDACADLNRTLIRQLRRKHQIKC